MVNSNSGEQRVHTEQAAISFREKCFVCGSRSLFSSKEGNPREATCGECGAKKRTSDLAKVLVEQYAASVGRVSSLKESLDALRHLWIYEAEASGPLHDLLSQLPHYVCSEYFDGVPSGASRGGVRCEDLRCLTFPENSFDLVITQDVLEHVDDPWLAFREIRRVLKPKGKHLFTVPFNPGHKTQRRCVPTLDGFNHFLPPVYHGDPLRPEGALVYTDYGSDLVDLLERMGFETRMDELGTWYKPDEITWVSTPEQYENYLDARQRNAILPFFKYNSVVFVAQNLKLETTGERFIPELRGDIAYEHLHRYAIALPFIKGKRVLDIACGEGYGTALMGEKASYVLGVDLNAEVVAYARKRYRYLPNVEFREGQCERIPCADRSIDVVVSFETIEHFDDHLAFLREIRRILKEDGILILSSPNKKTYTDEPQHKNPFHRRELYFSELKDLLHAFFPYVKFLGQRLVFSSHLWPIEHAADGSFIHYHGTASEIVGSHQPHFEPVYYVAICSFQPVGQEVGYSLFTDEQDFLLKHAHCVPEQIEAWRNEVARRDALIRELSNRLSNMESNSSYAVEMFLREARALAAAGTKEPARELLHHLSCIAPKHGAVWNERGVLEFELGNVESALECFQTAVEHSPNDLCALKNLADILYESNQAERALAVYKRILDLSPNDAETLFILGNICLETGRHQDARFFYERVLQIAPDHEPAKRNLIALEVFHDQKLGEPSTQRVAVVAESKETF